VTSWTLGALRKTMNYSLTHNKQDRPTDTVQYSQCLFLEACPWHRLGWRSLLATLIFALTVMLLQVIHAAFTPNMIRVFVTHSLSPTIMLTPSLSLSLLKKTSMMVHGKVNRRCLTIKAELITKELEDARKLSRKAANKK